MEHEYRDIHFERESVFIYLFVYFSYGNDLRMLRRIRISREWYIYEQTRIDGKHYNAGKSR